jgi:hypothetical protein
VTEDEQARAAEALAQLHRDSAAAAGSPPLSSIGSGKFTGPIGLDDDGNFQPALTEEEQDHNAAVRRAATSPESE